MKSDKSNRTAPRWLTTACGLILGVVVGVCLHYVIYRLSLPSTPFIYVAF